MFTIGRIIFIVFFVVLFIASLVWSYRKERGVNQTHYKNSYKVLLALIAFVSLLFFIVKIKKFL
ncbi:MAG: hypothetical protein KF900_09580 [Bacteroidetes bacterium]|nr:hypothetical protein [Bacteroidota bacterium]